MREGPGKEICMCRLYTIHPTSHSLLRQPPPALSSSPSESLEACHPAITHTTLPVWRKGIGT